jgi:DNA-binding LacI/PurR family transcriptional regulator
MQSSKTCTIQDVARALGITKSTVSQALSGKGTLSTATRERVRHAAREMGYTPNPLAQRLAHGQSRTLVCLLTGALDTGVGTNKVLLIQKELGARSLDAPLYTHTGLTDEEGAATAAQVQHLCRQRPQAIVCAGSLYHPAVFAALDEYQSRGGILVGYDMPLPLSCDQVIFDREDNAYQAARYLLEQGHRKIGVGVSRFPAVHPPGAVELPQTIRLRGVRRALGEAGLSLPDDWLFQNGPYEEGGEEMAARFLAMKDRPTGLCIVNDYVALAFMDELLQAGVKVPGDVSIVSHDNQPITRHCPVRLTSVSHPVPEIVQAVVEMLADRLDGYDGSPRTQVIRGELVQRQSVAPPPA